MYVLIAFICLYVVYLFIYLNKSLSLKLLVVLSWISQILEIIFMVKSFFILSSYACS